MERNGSTLGSDHSLMSYFKTVPVPDRGVNYGMKPHAMDPRSWFNMEHFRTKNGTVRNFEGWNSIVAAPVDGPVHGIFELFDPFNLERYFALATPDTFYDYNVVTGETEDRTADAGIGASYDDPYTAIVFNGALYLSGPGVVGGYKWLGTGNLVTIATMPSFTFLNTINDYLVGFHQCDVEGHFPYRLRWAAEGTDNVWIAAQNNDAGDFNLDDSPDQGLALYKLGNDLIAYKERSIIPVTYIGGNEIFGRRAAITGVGLISSYALAAAGDRHLFMGQETFYAYSGGNTIDDSIGDAIRDKVFSEFNAVNARQVRAIYLRERLEVVWFYPALGAVGDGCNRFVVLNLKDGTWYGPAD